jgi:predicted Zn finger-like uncharacterized protein
MLITCSNCESKIRVPDSAAGKKGKCPKCGTVIAIPAAEEPIEAGFAETAPAEVTPPRGPGPVAEEPAASPFDFTASAPPPATQGSRKGEIEDDEVMEEPGEVDEEEERAPRRPKRAKENATLSIISMVLGILSLVCSCPSFVSWCVAPIPFAFGAAAIVTGSLGMKQGGRGMAIAGICCGGGGILLTIILIIANIFVGVALFTAGAAGGRR